MIRRLFTVASAGCLLLSLACLGLAIWASGARSYTFVARGGRFWELARSGKGYAALVTTPWPRDERLVAQSPSEVTWDDHEESRTDHWAVVVANGWMRMLPPDPWGKSPPGTTTVYWMIGVRPWRCAALFAVLPVAWAIDGYRRRRRRQSKGFPVEPIGEK